MIRTAIGLVLLCSSACTVGELGDSSNDDLDASHPYVGLLRAEGVSYCTGILVAPRVVLTAGHCVAGPVLPNPSFSIGGVEIAIASATPHPDLGLSGASDIGVAILKSDAPVVAIELAPEYGDNLSDDVLFVGHEGSSSDELRKRSRSLRVTKVGATTFLAGDSNVAKACEPLSGGPVLAEQDGRFVLVGMPALGDQLCDPEALSSRIDTHLDFLADFGVVAPEGDICEAQGWYDDDVCDLFCINPDPDCDGQAETTNDICEENGWYADGVCDTFCPLVDPECPVASAP